MSIISEEFFAARTGEVLEARLRESDKYQKNMEDLHKALRVFSKAAGLSKKTGNCMMHWTMRGQSIILCTEKNLTVWGWRMACR